MLSSNLFSIVIPTRQRHDTLKYSIQSVLSQTYSDFELVVMDNCSSLETAEVVSSFNDPRIKYYRTSERLSMSDNWELALSYATGEYIFILGDDDALMPDALELCLKLIKEYNVKIVSWFRYQYWWPKAIVPWLCNRLYLNLFQVAEIWNSREKLRQFYQCQIIFENLPMIYNSFIHKDIIARVKSLHGRYFMTYIPDVESGIVNAYFSEQYLYSFRGLSLAGLSAHSTGTSSGYSSLEVKPLKDFINEYPKDILAEMHPSLIQSTNQEISVADIQFRTKELYFPENKEIQVDIKQTLNLIASRINRDIEKYDQTLSEITAIAQKHEISISDLNIPLKEYNQPEPYQGPIFNNDYSTNTLVINCEQVGISNVAQAANLAQGILPKMEFLRVNIGLQKVEQEQGNVEEEVKQEKPIVLLDGVFFQLFKTGITRVWKSLLEEWIKTDFGQYIIILDRGGTAPKIPGYQYRLIPPYYSDSSDASAQREMLEQICLEEGADLFISTYYTTPISTPSVFMAYDMVPEVMAWDMNRPLWQDKHHAIRHASSYLAISENTANDLVRFFPEISRDSVKVAYCGVDRIFYPANPQEIDAFKDKYRIAKPYFLLVGLRGGYKNGMLFFQSFPKLENTDNFAIVCVGGGEELEQEFVTYISETNIYLLPHIEDNELRLAYSGAIALVYPSKYEGFGLPILEAMACGCPVITCPLASIPEVGGDAVIYINDDVEQMTDALRAIQNPDARESLIAAGFEQASKFSWSKMAKTVSSVLIDATLLHLKLRENNLIIFPDWCQSEEAIGRELEKVIMTIMTHPESQKITLLIDTSNLEEKSEIDANLVVSGMVMNLLMQEDLEMAGEPEISLVGKLSELQWEALLPRIQSRIPLKSESPQAQRLS
ncbi:MAG TPA: glycosyltransferase [Kamptonema sp.]|nr:glycosyltransferase [Kamptonema sp.]